MGKKKGFIRLCDVRLYESFHCEEVAEPEGWHIRLVGQLESKCLDKSMLLEDRLSFHPMFPVHLRW